MDTEEQPGDNGVQPGGIREQHKDIREQGTLPRDTGEQQKPKK